MKVKLVFDGWLNSKGENIYETPKGVKLSMRAFHYGTMFDAEIELSKDSGEELALALKKGYHPRFVVYQKELVAV